MKRMTISFLLLLLPLLLASGHAQSTGEVKEVALGEEFTVKVGQQVKIKDTKIKLTFLAVPQDSRCPSDVACVWAGNECEARFRSKESKATVKATLAQYHS